MEIFVTWTNKVTETPRRIRFSVEVNSSAPAHLMHRLWNLETADLKIYDSGYERAKGVDGRLQKGMIKRYRTGSTVFISSDVTVPEIVLALKKYMKEIYGVPTKDVEVLVSI